MAKLQWIKLSTELFGNPEIRILLALPGGQTAVLLYLFLLTAAGRLNDGGRAGISESLPYSDRFLSIQLGVSPEEARAGLELLRELELIDQDSDGFWEIRGWETQQTVEKDLQDREKNRLRKARYRSERAKEPDNDENDETDCPAAVPSCPTGTNRDCPASVPSCPTGTKEDSPVIVPPCPETDIEEEKDKETEQEKKESKKKKTAGRFHPPTADEVADYCHARGNRVDPQRFVDYYTANGWRVGRTPMTDWQAAVRTWERSGPRASPLSGEGRLPKGCPPGAVLGPTGIPILPNPSDELRGIL